VVALVPAVPHSDAPAWLSEPTGAYAFPCDRACRRGTTVLGTPALAAVARGRHNLVGSAAQNVIQVTFRSHFSRAMWSLADAHGQSRTLTVVYGHKPAAARIRARLHPAVLACTVDGGAEQGCRRCRAERPGVPADVDRRSGEESGNCASPRGVIPRQLAPLSGSGALYPASCACRSTQGPSCRPQRRGYAPIHDQGFREESTVAWSHRKEHHHGRAAVPVGSAAWAG
jgi:hypothetical protein